VYIRNSSALVQQVAPAMVVEEEVVVAVAVAVVVAYSLRCFAKMKEECIHSGYIHFVNLYYP